MAQRERRATAGKRMSTLTGKALEEDEMFWGHDTWAEDDSGNDSFRSSDEDSEVKKDVFDSDFDDSESDHEDEEEAAGAEVERELVKEEKRVLKAGVAAKHGAYVPVGRKRGPKRIVGDGMNAGVVLNAPGSVPTVQQLAPAAPRIPKPVVKRITAAATRPRRAQSNYKSPSNNSTDADRQSEPRAATPVPAKKRQRQTFTQEELLLEATRDTEPENARWLLARQRIRDQSEQTERESRENTGKLIERYTSRRGYLNTITFPEMDHVPEILSRRFQPQPAVPTFCVITGHRARYRDPQTGFGYYDAEAFREIRRRQAAGEPVDQRKPHPITVVSIPNPSSLEGESDAAVGERASEPPETTSVARISPRVKKFVDVSVASGHTVIKTAAESSRATKAPETEKSTDASMADKLPPEKNLPTVSVASVPPEIKKSAEISSANKSPAAEKALAAATSESIPLELTKVQLATSEVATAIPETRRKVPEVSPSVPPQPPPPSSRKKRKSPAVKEKTPVQTKPLAVADIAIPSIPVRPVAQQSLFTQKDPPSPLNGGGSGDIVLPSTPIRPSSMRSLSSSCSAGSTERRHSPRQRKPSTRALEAQETDSILTPRLKRKPSESSEPA